MSRLHTMRRFCGPEFLTLSKLQGHTGVVTSVAYSPRETVLASGSADRTIRLWDAVSGNCIDTLWVGKHLKASVYLSWRKGSKLLDGHSMLFVDCLRLHNIMTCMPHAGTHWRCKLLVV